MKNKVMSLLLIVIVLSIIMFSFILAYDGSSNNSDDDNESISNLNNTNNDSGDDDFNKTIRERTMENQREKLQNKSLKDCEEKDSRKDRIKCRLDERKDHSYFLNKSAFPEFCRNETHLDKCEDFMDKVRPCYKREGKEKLACFRRLSGLTNAALNGQGVKKDEMRLYVIALFNDLQLRVEQLNSEGKINNVTAVNMIDKITQINEKLVSGANASEVKPLIKELKALWKEMRISEKEQENDDDDNDKNASSVDKNDSDDDNEDDDSNETEINNDDNNSDDLNETEDENESEDN